MDEEGEKKFMKEYDTPEDYSRMALRTISCLTRASNALPAEAWDYYSTFKDFRRVMAVESDSAWDLIKGILNFRSMKAPKRRPETASDLSDFLIEVNDHMLERINTLLDEAEGLKKKEDVELLEVTKSGATRLSGSWNEKNFDKSKGMRLLTARNILRPQLKFKDKINNSNSPFIPRIKEKPNSKKPLSILVEIDDSGQEFFSHPYLLEIEHFKPKGSLMSEEKEEPRVIPLEEAQYELVDTPSKLRSMIQALKKEKEIAVDMEAHSYRSFMGIVCLIQISTLEKDYLVDPFDMWTEMTELNEIFTNPDIVKIFHGGDSDILWLQRDFSVYVVNMFDTHQAAILLEFPVGTRGLKNVLLRFAKITVDKQYQLADWRIRPLPEQMIKYAREDTRYLVYTYKSMKKELLARGNELKNLLKSAYDRSNDICKKRFKKPVLHESKHLELHAKNRQNFNAKQLYALKEIYAWRHRLARSEDESEHYVFPNHMMLSVCSELPKEMQGILALCNPVPPLVKQNLIDIHNIIYVARTKSLTATSAIQEDEKGHKSSSEELVRSDVVSDPLLCPLDFSQSHLKDKLETLWSKNNLYGHLNKRRRTRSLTKIFEKPKKSLDKIDKVIKIPLSPFARYKLLIPYMKSIQDEQDTNNSVNSRINSIRKHFDTLTDTTSENPKSTKEDIQEIEKSVVSQINSIRKHFDTLPRKTPKKSASSNAYSQNNDKSIESQIKSIRKQFDTSANTSDEKSASINEYTQENEEKLRNECSEEKIDCPDRLLEPHKEAFSREESEEMIKLVTEPSTKAKKKNRKRAKKRKFPNSLSLGEPSPKNKAMNYNNYDLSQLSKGASPNPKEFNPDKKFREKHAKNKKFKNAKKFNKKGNRSHSFK